MNVVVADISIPGPPGVSENSISAERAWLEEIELRVARRADELARQRQKHTAIDLDCWLLAEAEVFRAVGAFREVRR